MRRLQTAPRSWLVAWVLGGCLISPEQRNRDLDLADLSGERGRFAGELTPSFDFSRDWEGVDTLAALDLDGDGKSEIVAVGASTEASNAGAIYLYDGVDSTLLATGDSRADALGSLPAISISGEVVGALVHDDPGAKVNAGSICIVEAGRLGPKVTGVDAWGSVSGYNGALADADGRVLVGFPSAGEDAGAAFLVEMPEMYVGGSVEVLATVAIWGEPGDGLGQVVAAMDLDGDRAREFLLANQAGLIWIPSGLAAGRHDARVEQNGAIPLAGITALTPSGDLDGDGDADLVIVADGTAYVLASWDVAAGSMTPAAQVEAVEVATADLDDDGVADLVWITAVGHLGVAYGPLSGTITPVATAVGISHVAIADLDGDGVGDLVVSTASNVGVILGR